MDDKKWIEAVEKNRLLSWLLVIAILGCSVFVASSMNLLAYGEGVADPSSTYWFTFIIFAAGYSFWSSSIAANVGAKVVSSFFKALLGRLIKTRKLDDDDVKSISEEIFSEDNQSKMLSDVRKGTRNFMRAGVLFGFILGLVHALFVEQSRGLMGLAMFVAYGFAWGYLWYKLAWHGWVPLPSGEEA